MFALQTWWPLVGANPVQPSAMHDTVAGNNKLALGDDAAIRDAALAILLLVDRRPSNNAAVGDTTLAVLLVVGRSRIVCDNATVSDTALSVLLVVGGSLNGGGEGVHCNGGWSAVDVGSVKMKMMDSRTSPILLLLYTCPLPVGLTASDARCINTIARES